MVRISIALTLFSAGLSIALPHSVKRQGVVAGYQAGSSNVGLGNGQQFITGQCISPQDCASGCCVQKEDGTGECKARLVTEQAGGSCDFASGAAGGAAGGTPQDVVVDDGAADTGAIEAGEGAGNNNGTVVDNGSGANNGTVVENGNGANNGTQVDNGNGANNGTEINNGNGGNGAGNGATGACGAVAEASGSQNVGLGNGSQFITGQCFSAADCASGCCADQGDGTGRCGAEFPTLEKGLTCDFSCAA
ncbi:uncharacterized protein DNG_02140 [Cephalotrichum gorgonifer]|uniref:Biotrophy-associated secreted protein 2 n=1 Tax=Cephalotrichum gorgonifer TaxID=2041049 RepID=A0AAE8SSU0_9PEZI|nr:uncharacterized protein DNG_02140 [Cephalotrichum gorgonifer]